MPDKLAWIGTTLPPRPDPANAGRAGVSASRLAAGPESTAVEPRPGVVGLVLTMAIAVSGAAVILYFLHDRGGWLPDDGAYGHLAERLLGGEVLHRDLRDHHPGLVDFINAGALWLFGHDLVSMRYPLFALGLAEAVAIFWLLASRGALTAVVGVVAFTALSFVQFPNPSANWYALAWTVAIIAVLAFMPAQTRWRLEIVGLLVAATLLTRHLTGVLVGVGVLAFVLAEGPSGRDRKDRLLARSLLVAMALALVAYLGLKTMPLTWFLLGLAPVIMLAGLAAGDLAGNRRAIVILARLTIGGVIGVSPFLGYFAWHGALGDLIDDVLILPLRLTGLTFFEGPSYAWLVLASLRETRVGGDAVALINGLYWAVLLVLPAMLGGRVAWTMWHDSAADRPGQPLPFIALFHALVAAHYQIPAYLYFAIGLVLVGWLAAPRPRPNRGAALAVAAALIPVALVFHAGQPLSRSLFDHAIGRRVTSFVESRLPRASLELPGDEHALYQRLLAVIDAETRPEDAILALPVNPELYFMSARRNPTNFYNSGIALDSDAAMAEALDRLARDPPTLVVHRADDKYNEARGDKIMASVRQHYQAIAVEGPFTVYRRPAANSAAPIAPGLER